MSSVSRDSLVIGTRYQITTPDATTYKFGTWSSTPGNIDFELPEKNEFRDINEYRIALNKLPDTDFPDTSKTYTFLPGKEGLEETLKGLLPPHPIGGTRKRQKRRTTRKRT